MSGKWTAEEETFANRLIEGFEGGTLLDCDDGSTLRSYLAKRLNCAPMRISKKFAGLCIGKVRDIQRPPAFTRNRPKTLLTHTLRRTNLPREGPPLTRALLSGPRGKMGAWRSVSREECSYQTRSRFTRANASPPPGPPPPPPRFWGTRLWAPPPGPLPPPPRFGGTRLNS
ncbi:hypothetical protein B484DRAFT_339569 [Ochromonadaceae sp. CCMP2298]|nr:hypothetical protein B484DRAFT_339569 [Ochromonadaceae sp. CCMP2298]